MTRPAQPGASSFSSLLADNRHLLGGLVARHVGLVTNYDHCLVGRSGLDDRALLVQAAYDVELGREGRSGCTNQNGDGQHILEHFASPCSYFHGNNAPGRVMFLWRERPSIICTCSEYPFIYELNIAALQGYRGADHAVFMRTCPRGADGSDVAYSSDK